MYGLKRTKAPTLEVLTLRQIKDQLAIPRSDLARDPELKRLGKTAVERLEDFTSVACGLQEWELSLDNWLSWYELPRYPVTQVIKLEYRGTDDAWAEIPPTDYELDDSRQPARLLYVSSSPPNVHSSRRPVVRITFEAGHADRFAIPGGIIDAGLKLTEDLDRYRGVADGQDMSEPVRWALEPYRLGDEFTQYGLGALKGVVG